MTTLRQAAQQAMEAMLNFPDDISDEMFESITALKAALAEPVQEPQPLTEEEIEKAYREIWRGLPSDFDHTSAGWIEQGIRYAERAHGIT